MSWKSIKDLFCKHPIEKGVRIHTIHTERTIPASPPYLEELVYVVNIYKCSVCGRHFLNEGFEERSFSMRPLSKV